MKSMTGFLTAVAAAVVLACAGCSTGGPTAATDNASSSSSGNQSGIKPGMCVRVASGVTHISCHVGGQNQFLVLAVLTPPNDSQSVYKACGRLHYDGRLISAMINSLNPPGWSTTDTATSTLCMVDESGAYQLGLLHGR